MIQSIGKRVFKTKTHALCAMKYLGKRSSPHGAISLILRCSAFSSSRVQPQRVLIARYLLPAFDQDAESVPVLERTEIATSFVQPEILHEMCVGRCLTGLVIFVESKQSALLILKVCPACQVCKD
jgi:hypothetical protein